MSGPSGLSSPPLPHIPCPPTVIVIVIPVTEQGRLQSVYDAISRPKRRRGAGGLPYDGADAPEDDDDPQNSSSSSAAAAGPPPGGKKKRKRASDGDGAEKKDKARPFYGKRTTLGTADYRQTLAQRVWTLAKLDTLRKFHPEGEDKVRGKNKVKAAKGSGGGAGGRGKGGADGGVKEEGKGEKKERVRMRVRKTFAAHDLFSGGFPASSSSSSGAGAAAGAVMMGTAGFASGSLAGALMSAMRAGQGMGGFDALMDFSALAKARIKLPKASSSSEDGDGGGGSGSGSGSGGGGGGSGEKPPRAPRPPKVKVPKVRLIHFPGPPCSFHFTP